MDRNFIEEKNHLDYILHKIDDKVDYLVCNKPYASVQKYAVAYSNEEIEDLKCKKESNAYSDSQISDLNSFKDSPYFARMDLEYNEGGYDTETEKIYIGKKSLIIDYDQLVYDWRSPVGQRYYIKNEIKFKHDKYDYTLLLRRALDIKKGKLLNYNDEYVFGEEIFSNGITDPFLVRALREKRHEHRMTDIIKSIQENQNIIIRQPINKSFVVQGCAGSGKTMILLHRLSYLIFNNKNLNPDNIKIITPNENFNININELSNELGLEKIERLTVTDYYIKLINKYDRKLLRNSDISINESVMDGKFLNEVYSESFYKYAEDEYRLFIDKLFDKQTLTNIKILCLMKNLYFETNGNISDNYKLENYKTSIHNILDSNLKRKNDLYKLEDKFKNSIEKLEDVKQNSNELALQEQINQIEIDLIILSNDISNDLINTCHTHQAKINHDINKQDLLSFINSFLLDNKKLTDKYNNTLKNIDKIKVNIHENINTINLLSEKIDANKELLENSKKELETTTFYNFIKKRRLIKKIKNLENNINNNNFEYKNLLDKGKLYNQNLQLFTSEAASIQNNLLSEEELIKINKYADILLQNKMNLENFKKKLQEIQINKEKDIKKLHVEINSLELETSKLKEIVLGENEQSFVEKYYDVIGKVTPVEIYRNTIEKVLSMKLQKHNIEKSNLVYRFDLYLQLLFCVLFYGRVQNYDTFLNIDEGQDLSASEYMLFNLANGGNVIFNIYGDLNQRISSKGIVNWNQVAVARNNFMLNENYRNTNEITNYCNKVLNMNALSIGVEGNKVINKTSSEALAEIKNIVNNLGKDRYAVIIDSRNSIELSNILIDIGCVKNKILPGKISVLTVEQSKGLEFDCIYVYDKYMNKNEKYISYTRALKELIIVSN